MKLRRTGTVMFLLSAFAVVTVAGDHEKHQVLTTDIMKAREKPEEKTPETETVPVALIERIQTIGTTTTRVSLFDNRVAIVTMREKDHQYFFRKWTLGIEEYEVYLRAIKSVVASAGIQQHNNIDSKGVRARIFLRFPGMENRSFSYSPLQVQDLATNRLNGILDDIQAKIQAIPPAAEELRYWRPKEGDRVELFSGRTAVVGEVREDGSVILEHDDISIIELVPPEARAEVIYRILP